MIVKTLVFVGLIFTGSPHTLMRDQCQTAEETRAMMGEQFPQAVTRELSNEQLDNFRQSIFSDGFIRFRADYVIYFENPGYDTYFIVAFSEGCVVEQGSMMKQEFQIRASGNYDPSR